MIKIYVFFILFFCGVSFASTKSFESLKILEGGDGINISIYRTEEVGWRDYSRYLIEYCEDHKCYVFSSSFSEKSKINLIKLIAYFAQLSNYAELKKLKLLGAKGSLLSSSCYLVLDGTVESVVKLRKAIVALIRENDMRVQLKTYDQGEYSVDLDIFELQELLAGMKPDQKGGLH